MVNLIPIALGLAQFAPSILRFFGAGEKSAEVAEQVVNIASAITGETDPSKLQERLAANAEQALRFQEVVLANETRLEEAFLADRQDARKRDAVFLASGTRNYRADSMYLLAVAVVLVLFYHVVQRPDLNEFAKGVVTLVLGRFLGYLDGVYQFEFGTTRASKTKDDTINKLSGE